ITHININQENKKPYEFTVKTNKEDRRGTTYFVDQYQGTYTKMKPNVLDGFFMTMFKMHRWLLLDMPVGRPIVGVATIIFLILSITGIVLWFPKKKLKKLKWKHLKPGFKIARSEERRVGKECKYRWCADQ